MKINESVNILNNLKKVPRSLKEENDIDMSEYDKDNLYIISNDKKYIYKLNRESTKVVIQGNNSNSYLSLFFELIAGKSDTNSSEWMTPDKFEEDVQSIFVNQYFVVESLKESLDYLDCSLIDEFNISDKVMYQGTDSNSEQENNLNEEDNISNKLVYEDVPFRGSGISKHVSVFYNINSNIMSIDNEDFSLIYDGNKFTAEGQYWFTNDFENNNDFSLKVKSAAKVMYNKVKKSLIKNESVDNEKDEVFMADSDKDEFNYQMLGRLKSDCDYYLGEGNRNERHLWAHSVSKQIAKMREFYDKVPVKPEWLTKEMIDDYENKMSQTINESIKEPIKCLIEYNDNGEPYFELDGERYNINDYYFDRDNSVIYLDNKAYKVDIEYDIEDYIILTELEDNSK